MSFEQVDDFINKIKMEHKFEYLCSSQYPFMEIPELEIKACENKINKENLYIPNIEAPPSIPSSKFNVLQEKIEKIQNEIEKMDVIECPICLDYCIDYVRPKCNHKICVNCFVKNNKTINSNKCCLCRKKIY